MPNIGYSPAVEPDIGLRRGWMVGRGVLLGAVLAGIALAALATSGGEAAQAVRAAGPELTRLLRAMAGLKLVLAAGVLAGFYWRLGTPAGLWRLAGYAAAAAAMAAGPVLIWDMAHVGLGALLLHGGLLGGVLLLWRDPAVGACLGAMVARRRAVLRAVPPAGRGFAPAPHQGQAPLDRH
jgi:hypothetical protein